MFTIKKQYSITLIILFCSIIVFISLYLIYLPINKNNIDNLVIEGFNSNPIFSNDKLQPIQGGFNGYINDTGLHSIQITKNNPFAPVISVVRPDYSKDFPEKTKHSIFVIYFSRKGINNFEIRDYKLVTVLDLEFNQVTDLVSKHDITTDFPGKENYNIVNYPPLTQEEIQDNQEMVEETQNNQVNYAYLIILTREYEATTSIISLQTLVDALKATVTSLENNQTHTFPDGSTLTPTEKHLKDMQETLEYYTEDLSRIQLAHKIELIARW